MKIGDKVVFVNSDFGWCGEDFTVTYVGESIARVMNDSGISQTFGKCNLEVVEQKPTNDFQRAWESVWDTICNHAPKDLFNQITQDGSGIENAVDLIKVLSKHYKEPIKSASTVQHLQTFTLNHKNIEISFEDGKITAKDWRGNGDPVEYAFDMIEQLEELMGAWEVICKFKVGVE